MSKFFARIDNYGEEFSWIIDAVIFFVGTLFFTYWMLLG